MFVFLTIMLKEPVTYSILLINKISNSTKLLKFCSFRLSMQPKTKYFL